MIASAAAAGDATVLAAIEQQFESPSSDGLPVVPPTRAAVAAMVERSGLEGGEVLGEVAPSNAPITVEQMAINAVMAGCRADYAPVLVAVVRAMTDEAFDLVGVACSTKGSAPLVIVGGPVCDEIGINCRGNVFGHGFRANATIGRAVRLIILNVGRSIPNQLDRGTLGHPGRFSYCIGEDSDAPWEPLHSERGGLNPGQSAVTIFGGEGMRLVNNHYNEAEAVLHSVADCLASTSIYNESNITARSPHVLVFAKEHRDLLATAGWTKRRIREFIHEHAVVSAAGLRAAGNNGSEAERVVGEPDDLLVVAAGGSAGRFAGVIPGWSWQSQPVTKAVTSN